jgi:hypothetical protein
MAQNAAKEKEEHDAAQAMSSPNLCDPNAARNRWWSHRRPVIIEKREREQGLKDFAGEGVRCSRRMVKA